MSNRRKKPVMSAVIASAALGIFLSAGCSPSPSTGGSSAPAPSVESSQTVGPPDVNTDIPDEVLDDPDEALDLTTTQFEARESAESYLAFAAFSRSGLIDQLKFEGFSKADATAAVDSLNVDWNEQAAKSAESYLNTSSFSRSGLIEQLAYEGFSQSQAEYGVDAAFGDSGGAGDGGGGGDSVSRQNAIESAESYLQYAAFSRSGLIEQLEYEGYSSADATYAVDSVNANWKEQAAKSAESYLEFSSFSRSELIDQLVYEGFSRSEAEYGAAAVGL
ncbi:MAG: hypothetical protein B7C55_04615 [Actinomycetales bacterium mxb001]|nr:MAG: hypothetical protein B7C55_04615 [Actinomycetales bacterium mxb001]